MWNYYHGILFFLPKIILFFSGEKRKTGVFVGSKEKILQDPAVLNQTYSRCWQTITKNSDSVQIHWRDKVSLNWRIFDKYANSRLHYTCIIWTNTVHVNDEFFAFFQTGNFSLASTSLPPLGGVGFYYRPNSNTKILQSRCFFFGWKKSDIGRLVTLIFFERLTKETWTCIQILQMLPQT